MPIDYHTHVLPGLDDGAKDAEMSVQMLELLRQQGVSQVIATPHFYAHKEQSAVQFLERRQQAFEKIEGLSPLPILLGAEVAVERGISEMQDIEKLAIQGTDVILLELPYRAYKPWMGEEIYNVSVEYGLRVMLAHVHRYLAYYSKAQLRQILDMEVLFQINNEAFDRFRERRFVKSLIKQGYPLVFGSDCHNMTDRRPNWDSLKRRRIAAGDFLEET